MEYGLDGTVQYTLRSEVGYGLGCEVVYELRNPRALHCLEYNGIAAVMFPYPFYFLAFPLS